jgi:hypothetical protein
MKEKNITKVLLIISVILIIALILFIFKNNGNKNNNNTNKANENPVATNFPSQVKTLSVDEALPILQSKFEMIEKIYFSPNLFFIVNQGEEIKDFDEIILRYGTENFLEEIHNNMPTCINIDNGKYYYVPGGGAVEYAGFDGFENVKVTDSTITATLKTKQTTFNGTEWVSTDDKSSEFTLVKSGDKWLIDVFNSSDFN